MRQDSRFTQIRKSFLALQSVIQENLVSPFDQFPASFAQEFNARDIYFLLFEQNHLNLHKNIDTSENGAIAITLRIVSFLITGLGIHKFVPSSKIKSYVASS
jgi:hypothetical protein